MYEVSHVFLGPSVPFTSLSAFGRMDESTKAIGRMAKHMATEKKFDRMDQFDTMGNGKMTSLFAIRDRSVCLSDDSFPDVDSEQCSPGQPKL